ncbi:MAG: toxin TcdB middle/N-terminal domain-containing protein, partial [bacterium]
MFGNSVRYHYSNDTQSLQLDSIRYTNKSNEDGVHLITFTYKDREYQNSSYRYGFRTSLPNLTCSFDVSLGEFSFDGIKQRYYFEYSQGDYSNQYEQLLIGIYKADKDFTVDEFCLEDDPSSSRYQVHRDMYGSLTKFEYNQMPDESALFGAEKTIADAKINKTDGYSISSGASVGGGIGGEVYNNHLSVKGGYTYDYTETTLQNQLLDIDGDGLPDRVYKNNNAIYYRKLQTDAAGNASFGEERLINGISDIQKQYSHTHSASLDLSFGVYLKVSYPYTDSRTSTYFSDVNSDGLPDLVTPIGIYFNQLDEDGVPTFTNLIYETGSDTIRTNTECKTIIFDGEVDTNIVCELEELFLECVSLEGLDNSMTQSWYKILSARYGPLTHDTINGMVYIYGTEKTCIENQAPQIEAVKTWIAPHYGIVTIINTLQLIEDLSDSRAQSRTADGVTLITQRNYSLSTDSTKFTSGSSSLIGSISIEPDNYTQQKDTCYALVDEGDVLFFRLNSNENTSFDNILVEHEITYLNYSDNLDQYGLAENYYSSGDNFLCYGDDVFKAPINGRAEVSIVGYIPYSQGVIGLASYLNSNSNYLNVYPFYNGTKQYSFSTDLQEGDELKFVLSKASDSPVDWGQTTTQVKITYYPDGASDSIVFYAQVQISDAVDSDSPYLYQKLFGPTYRGWGHFAYENSSSSTLIPLSSLQYTYGEALNALQYVDESDLEAKLSNFEASIDTVALNSGDSTTLSQAAISTLLSDMDLSNPLDNSSKWIQMYPNMEKYRFESVSLSARIDKTSMSNQIEYNTPEGYFSEGIVYIDHSVPNPSSTMEVVKTINKHRSTSQITAAIGLESTSLGVNGAYSWSKIQSDYFDINGDGYPDFIGLNSVQYTNPWGGIGELQISTHEYETSFAYNIGSNVPYTPAINYILSRGNKSSSLFKGSFGASAGQNSEIISYADINGDGLPDRVNKSDMNVEYNQGYYFSSPTPISEIVSRSGATVAVNASEGTSSINIAEYSFALGLNGSLSYDASNCTLVDINGDGKLDIINTPLLGGIEILLGVGDNTYASIGDLTQRAHDESGVSTQYGVSASVTFGATFFGFKIPITISGNYGSFSSSSTSTFIDMNNDGYVDLVYKDGDDLKVRYNQSGAVNRLKTITNPTGHKIEIDYELSDNTSAQPRRKWDMVQVKSTDVNTLSGDSVYVVDIDYSSPHYDRMERDNYGYAKVVETHNPQMGGYAKVFETEYSNCCFLYKNDLLRQKMMDPSGLIYTEKVYTYNYQD